MTWLLPEDEVQECELRWIERGSSDIRSIVVPVGPATFVTEDRWIFVPRRRRLTVMVEPGQQPRLAGEADVLGAS